MMFFKRVYKEHEVLHLFAPTVGVNDRRDSAGSFLDGFHPHPSQSIVQLSH